MARSYGHKAWDLLRKWLPDGGCHGWPWLTNLFWKLFILKLPSQHIMKYLDVILCFFIENILHCKWSFKVRHRIDQNLRTILCEDNIKMGKKLFHLARLIWRVQNHVMLDGWKTMITLCFYSTKVSTKTLGFVQVSNSHLGRDSFLHYT